MENSLVRFPATRGPQSLGEWGSVSPAEVILELCRWARVGVMSEAVLRVPGSPQPEASRVRGSWRDYLVDDPPWASGGDSSSDGDGEEFEPFSEDDDVADTMSTLDLSLFEPRPKTGACRLCCVHCRKNLHYHRPPHLQSNMFMLKHALTDWILWSIEEVFNGSLVRSRHVTPRSEPIPFLG
ncbi:hypothetical protein AAG570_009060 [Ranatra chinensis]|uniref:Uncharacterized protein n=1 Tax=Ranatra chinensis TaxID=642074 RepID=A0ABD0YSN4_9HEMI